jgi:hypothetical protein
MFTLQSIIYIVQDINLCHARSSAHARLCMLFLMAVGHIGGDWGLGTSRNATFTIPFFSFLLLSLFLFIKKRTLLYNELLNQCTEQTYRPSLKTGHLVDSDHNVLTRSTVMTGSTLKMCRHFLLPAQQDLEEAVPPPAFDFARIASSRKRKG